MEYIVIFGHDRSESKLRHQPAGERINNRPREPAIQNDFGQRVACGVVIFEFGEIAISKSTYRRGFEKARTQRGDPGESVLRPLRVRSRAPRSKKDNL